MPGGCGETILVSIGRSTVEPVRPQRRGARYDGPMPLPYLLLLVSLVLVGCPSAQEAPLPCEAVGGSAGLVDGTLVNPFPSFHVTRTTPEGCRVFIPPGALPVGPDSDPMPVGRFDVRDGFSAGQTSYWRPGVAVDASSLPSWSDSDLGLGVDASVQIWDLDAGVQLPAFAEVDAFLDQANEQRAVLIRPLAPLPFGTRVAVVVTDRVTMIGGGSVPASSTLLSLRDPGPTSPDDARAQHYQDLFDRLQSLGVERDSVVMTWDFPVASRDSLVAPLDTLLDGMRQELPAEPDFEPVVSIDALLDRDLDAPLVSGLWRELRGSARLTHYLWAEVDDATEVEHDAGMFRLDDVGNPIPRAVDDAFFIAVVPESVRGAAPGSVPVVVFGHGIFSAPRSYLTAPGDPNGTIELLNRLGAVGIGGEWRGLTERDRPDAIRVAANLGRFPLITDKMVQGVSNQVALPRLMKTQFRNHEAFVTQDGESMIDVERIYYFGISLGGIEGLTLMANSQHVSHGVLHVPGSTWSTMLERSTNWNAFEPFVIESVTAPWDRQLLYTVSQLLWDPVDPVSHYRELNDASLLMQVSVGDEQVPNFTAELLARGAGIPLVTPAVNNVPGLDAREAPFGPDARGYMQFDPQMGAPPEVNRPQAVASGAHGAIRGANEVMSQIESFFASGSAGTIVNPCGPEPCILDVE